MGGGHRDGRRGRGDLLGRPRLRAVPLPGLPGAERRDGVLVPLGAVLGRRQAALPPSVVARRQPTGPRARRHRASRPRRVLPDLLGPHALREGAGHPGPGPGQRDQLDRVVHARDQPGRADPAQPPVRAVHQRGPDDVPGRRHRLQLGAPRGGHPVRLQPLRARAHRDGLQPRHLPGTVGGPGGRVRAGLSATVGGPRGEGARDVRQRHGPARPRGRWRLRRILPAGGRGAAAGDRVCKRRRGTRLRRRDGPAQHADAAGGQGSAMAPAAEARGSERAATLCLDVRGAARRRRWAARRSRKFSDRHPRQPIQRIRHCDPSGDRAGRSFASSPNVG